MTFDHACQIFEAMDEDQRARVARSFAITWGSQDFPGWRDAFAHAVAEEAYRTEREMLLEQETEGIG